MAILETASEEPVVVPLRDPYGVAQAASVALQRNPDDTDARGMYGRALCALKLFDAMGRLSVDSSGTPLGGLIPWTSRARRFAANLRALEQRSPDGAALVRAAADSLSRYELHQSADGNYHILDTHAPVWAGWLGGKQGALTNHKLAEQLWQYDPQKTPMPPPFLFDGLSLGWLFLHALRSTERAFLHYRCALYVLERDPLALAMALHIHDLQEVILSPRTRWFIASTGEEVLSAFHASLTNNTAWSIPQIIVRSTLRPNSHLPMEESLTDLRNARQKKNDAWTAASTAYYDDKDMEFWRDRFSGEVTSPPLRVLGITSRYTTVLQHSMAELQQAVAAWHFPTGQTAEMRIAIEPDDQSLENPLFRMISEFKPDLIVQISRMRYENDLLPRNVPFLCWDQDNLSCMRTEAAAASLDAFTYVAGQGALQGYVYQNWPLRNALPCHLASATRRYQPRVLSDEERSRYACDFSYISNAAAAPTALRNEHMRRFGDFGFIFREVTDYLLAHPWEADASWHEDAVRELVMRTLESRFASLPPQFAAEMTTAATLVADRAFRHQTLHWISRYCAENNRVLRIYGHGWNEHPTLAHHAAGPATPGSEVEAITLASTVNLQIIATSILHSRLLDGLATGAFFLFRRTSYECGELAFHESLQTASRCITERQLQTFDELDAIGDPDIAQAWTIIASDYRRRLRESGLTERTLIRGIASAQFVPHPFLLLPRINDIGFSTEAEFCTKADAFLSDPRVRSTLGTTLRESVQKHFSYDRRWEQFLAHIRCGLSLFSDAPQ